MPRDTSLDEFFHNESAQSDDTDQKSDERDGDPGAAIDDAGQEPENPTDEDATYGANRIGETAVSCQNDLNEGDSVELAEVVFDVSPDGDACAACDKVVIRRWRDENGMVCSGCKEW